VTTTYQRCGEGTADAAGRCSRGEAVCCRLRGLVGVADRGAGLLAWELQGGVLGSGGSSSACSLSVGDGIELPAELLPSSPFSISGL
jgi:hypothetical protein